MLETIERFGLSSSTIHASELLTAANGDGAEGSELRQWFEERQTEAGGPVLCVCDGFADVAQLFFV